MHPRSRKDMMVRRKGVPSLTVWMMAALLSAPLASACVWCDSVQWRNFQDCLNSRIRNEPFFSRISVRALDDMRDSNIAAYQEGSSPMKMKMLIGAMAGEMSELIKPMSSNGNDGRAKATLMDIVHFCNVQVSGQPDFGFSNELGRTIDFMMGEPSYGSPDSVPKSNNVLLQNAVQSFTNQANFNDQNINNPPPDFNNVRQPPLQPQLPLPQTILNNPAPYRGNNQQSLNGIPFPNNQINFPGQATSGQRNINAATLPISSQPQIPNANGASGLNSFNQNPSINPTVTNTNAASSSYSLSQSQGFQQQTNSANLDRGPYGLNQYPSVQAKNIDPNSGNRPFSLNPSPSIQPQITRANGRISANSYNSASTNTLPQNNIQNQFPPRDSFPVNNGVPSGPLVVASRTNSNFQNKVPSYNEDRINNAAKSFYQQLSYDLSTSPYMSNIFNEETTKTSAKANTASLLGSLSVDYENLVVDITKECISRLSSVLKGSNTEAYTTLIATCITDVLLRNELISLDTPSAQASDISSKIITWLKGDTDDGTDNQLANRNVEVQSSLPNQGVTNYPDYYSDVTTLGQRQQPASSEVLVSNYGENTDYKLFSDDSDPQYQLYDDQNFNSNSPAITNDGLQNIRTFSNANSSQVKNNKNKRKNKNSNKKNKRNTKKCEKKKTAVSKTNFNFDNLNNNYRYTDYLELNTSPDISNGDYFTYYGNLDYQPDNVPTIQSPEFQNYPAQIVNQDYDLSTGATKIQNDNLSGTQQIAFPSDLSNPPRRKKCKNLKRKKGKIAVDKPLINDGSDTNNYLSNQGGQSALDRTNNPQTLKSNEYAGSPNSDNGAKRFQNTASVPFQSQIIPNEKNSEVKDRVQYLIKGILSSMSNGKFDYNYFGDIIAEVSKNLQTTHPEIETKTVFIKTLIDSLIACTQLLTKVQPNYFNDIGIFQNSNTPGATAKDYSNRILVTQDNKSQIQRNQNKVALNDQSYGILQQNNLNNDQTKQTNFYPSGSAPSPNTNVPPPRLGSGIQSFPQNVGGNGLSSAQTSTGISSQIGQVNSQPSLPNGYESKNLPLNNQNNVAFQPSRDFNNPNLPPRSTGNQNTQSGKSFLSRAPQANKMYDNNPPQNNQMLNLPGG